MTICGECGASLTPEENFCGSCGAHRQGADASIVSQSGSVSKATGENPDLSVSDYSPKLAEDGSTWREEKPDAAPAPAKESRSTGELAESAEFSPKTSRADSVPDKRPKPKVWKGAKSSTAVMR